ncbi:MAG: lamin tail domain-containing protein, partial [Planctomycetota bacterium]
MNKKLQLPVYDTGKTWRHKTAISAGISLLSLAMIVSPAASAEVVVSELMYHPYSAQNVPENIRQEYIELFNRGTAAVNLSGWRFSNAVNFVFPDVTLGAGRYLVVAADVDTFKAVHPGVSNVVGGWDGKLSNSGERIELVDSIGVRIDSLRYADQGDWGVRELGPVDRGHRGWLWISEHDGAGKSMELINPALPNEYGQNWTASNLNDGTPGAINSAIAPLIVDVTHLPIIPGADEPVTVSARIIDELTSGIAVTLYYRVDVSSYQDEDIYPYHVPADYQYVTMLDDGAHGDGKAGDGIYGAEIPAQPDEAIVEFYVEASDAGANRRTWPSPSIMDGTPEQVTNALYQVNDSANAGNFWTPGRQPVYYVIMTEADKGRLLDIGDREGGEHNSDTQVNATFVSVDGIDAKVRHNIGVRNRGHGSRNDPPNNYRVNFPHDRPWKGVTAINLNTKYTYYQLAGNALFRVTTVQVRLNGENFADSGREMYGSYAHVEVVDSDFADRHFPDDGAGNVYKCMRDLGPADLRYRGENPDSYRNSYLKRTNTAEDDFSGIIDLCFAFSDNTPDSIYVREVNRVIDVDQWLRYFAINALLDNSETSLPNGFGDDYYLYRGVEDPRFVLIQHDLDTIFGRSGSTTAGIFRAAALPAVNRFLRHPEFLPRYYFHLRDLIETTFSAERLGPFLDDLLGDFVPSSTIEQMKRFVEQRNSYVLSLIPSELTVEGNLLQLDEYYQSGSDTFSLFGTADAVETRSVKVNGLWAKWSPEDGTWDFGGAAGVANTLIGAGSVWKYLDDGSSRDAPSDSGYWFAHPAYDDSLWLEGPAELGYGDAYQGRPEATVVNSGPGGNHFITTYFRHSFSVGRASQYISLHLQLLRDDGAIVYLNGVEVARSNMPGGPVDYLTRAGANISGSGESTFYDFAVDASLLSSRINVLAVELHQFSGTSADISFDLRLDGIIPTPGAGTLRPGINRVLVQTFDGPEGVGNQLESDYIDILYDDGDVVEISGTLASDTILDAASGPWHVTNDLTVPVGVTLTIGPGATVFFEEDTRLTINGRLVAEGTEYERIRLTRQPGSSSTWNGLHFDSAEDNRLAFLDMEYSSRDSESIRLDDSRVLIDNVTWAGTDKTIIRIGNSSLIVRGSIFPETTVQTISGHRALSSDPYIIFENNIFGICSGDKQDVVDFSISGPSPIPQFINNVFLGGGDDGLDLDGTNAYIEGNVFVNFHRNFSPEEGEESYAISTGYDGGNSSNHVIVRNLFIDCDNAVLVKDRSWVTFENNTVVGCTGAGINFDEPLENDVEPGDGAYLDGNIFRNVNAIFGELTASTDLTVNRSILLSEWLHLGIGNVDADPLLVDDSSDFALQAGSPAIGAGPCGLDMGAFVPSGAAICGEPAEITYRTDAALTVGGPGITHYKYLLGDGLWGEELPVNVPIVLTNLLDGGSYAVQIIGRNSAGLWQSEDEPTTSRTWIVDVSSSRPVINEVLARNSSAVEHEGIFPDMVELYFDGPAAMSLSGMSITDNPDDPTKFIFPSGITIEPGEYLLLYADSETVASGIHLGFALAGEGEGLYLYNSSGVLLDSVEFGLQLPDLSIGRAGYDGQWRLTVPTPGLANIAQPLGDPAMLKINEWLTNGEVLFEDDFIELFNPHNSPVDLSSLYLTDNPVTQPGKHQLGPLSFIAGEGFVVFSADGRDKPGHVDFRLSADGEMIGLFDAELNEIDKVIYGPQTTDVSQGRAPDGTESFEFFALPTPGIANPSIEAGSVSVTTLVPENADKLAMVPTQRIGQTWRRDVGFDDSDWIFGAGSPGGVGFESRSGYEALISIDLEAQMYSRNTSCYIRIPFAIEAVELARLTELALKIKYDDGFIAYLNGAEL